MTRKINFRAGFHREASHAHKQLWFTHIQTHRTGMLQLCLPAWEKASRNNGEIRGWGREREKEKEVHISRRGTPSGSMVINKMTNSHIHIFLTACENGHRLSQICAKVHKIREEMLSNSCHFAHGCGPEKKVLSFYLWYKGVHPSFWGNSASWMCWFWTLDACKLYGTSAQPMGKRTSHQSLWIIFLTFL